MIGDTLKSKIIEKMKRGLCAHKVTDDQRIMKYACNSREASESDLIVISTEKLFELIKERIS